jgi:hypothetical protein
LIWNAAEEEDPVHVALYQAVEAKKYAERIQGVGVSTDAWLLSPDLPHAVPVPRVIQLIDRVFEHESSLPFGEVPSIPRRSPLPRDWERILRNACSGVLTLAAGGGQPTVSETTFGMSLLNKDHS